MTLCSINERSNSYILKHICEDIIGEYVSDLEIKVILALRNVRGTNRYTIGPYPINLAYPMTTKQIKYLIEVREKAKDDRRYNS